jgi:2-methylisocitrate lyase-like PEP mutase family enzyme
MLMHETTMTDRVETFHRLHQSGCFLIPNPWDAGSARALAALGFQALATTSAGCAWAAGEPDHGVTLSSLLAHLRQIVDSVALPVSADFENGLADDPDGVAANVTAAAGTGIAGLSIEDAPGGPGAALYDAHVAVERIRAARQAIDASGKRLLLTARCEAFLVGQPDVTMTIDRLVAYAGAGADCLYAPGIRDLGQIAEVVRAVAPKPVNVLVGGDFTTVAQLADLGVRRISVGGALARTAWTGFLAAAREIATDGTFRGFAQTVSHTELNELFDRRA